jgi:hypothetical protein
MNTEEIIASLEQDRDRLSAAIYALSGKRPGRPPGTRRGMNAAGRKRISVAMKKRWAAKKKSA